MTSARWTWWTGRSHLMQDAVMRYRLAAYPPDVQIDIPVDACGTLDFHRAKELIALGRERAVKAFDAWEEVVTLSYCVRAVLVPARKTQRAPSAMWKTPGTG